jgi:hypothetical protein
MNLPLGSKSALALGGGYGAIFQNEYMPLRLFINGGTQSSRVSTCATCSRDAYQGPYLEARLSGQSDKYTGLGVTAKSTW